MPKTLEIYNRIHLIHLELIVFWSTLATRNDSRTHPASVFWVWSGTNCSRPAMACLKRVRPPLVIPAQDVPQSLSGVDFINVFFFVDCSKRQFPIKILKNCLYICTVMIKILLMKLPHQKWTGSGSSERNNPIIHWKIHNNGWDWEGRRHPRRNLQQPRFDWVIYYHGHSLMTSHFVL